MKQRILAIFSVCALIAALGACSNENNNNDTMDTTMTNKSLQQNSESSNHTTEKTAIQTKNENEVTLTGTIMYKQIEGGFYAFIAKNGDKYTLQGLDKAFQKNGLIVTITGITKPDLMTTTQYGIVLQVKDVKVLDSSKVIKDTSSL